MYLLVHITVIIWIFYFRGESLTRQIAITQYEYTMCNTKYKSIILTILLNRYNGIFHKRNYKHII